MTKECKCCRADGDCIEGLCVNCRSYNERLRKIIEIQEERIAARNKTVKILQQMISILELMKSQTQCHPPSDATENKNINADSDA